MSDNNGWDRWKELVLFEINQQGAELKEFRKEFEAFRLETAKETSERKGRLAAYGGIAGIAASIAFDFVKGFFTHTVK